MKNILTLAFIVTCWSTAFAQDSQQVESKNQNESEAYSYAYIAVSGRPFSKKLIVEVDLGDTPEQINHGEEYSRLLTNKKSYAAVLNYMVENGFELIETLSYTQSFQGSGETSGVMFIMKKKKQRE